MTPVKYVIPACIGLVAIMSAGDGLAQDLRKTSLRLDFSGTGYHATFYLGVAKGFYREQGIDLQVQEGKGSANTATVVGTGSDDFGFADATTTSRLVAQGLPAKVVLGLFQKPTLAIYFPTAGKIKKPADLKGTRISMCPPDGMAQYVPAYLEAVQLKTSDVEFVTVDCSVKYTVIPQGKADAVASYLTAGKPLLAAVGVAELKLVRLRGRRHLPAVARHRRIPQDHPGQSEADRAFQRRDCQDVRGREAGAGCRDRRFPRRHPLQKGREAVLKEALVSSFTSFRRLEQPESRSAGSRRRNGKKPRPRW